MTATQGPKEEQNPPSFRVSSRADAFTTVVPSAEQSDVTSRDINAANPAQRRGLTTPSERLYDFGDADEGLEVDNAAKLILACFDVLQNIRQVKELIKRGEIIQADIRYMELKREFASLSKFSEMSEGIALTILTALKVLSGGNLAHESMDRIDYLEKVVSEVKKSPNMGFASAMILADEADEKFGDLLMPGMNSINALLLNGDAA